MSEYRACREAYTTALLALAKKDPSIIVISSDARGSCSLNTFVETLPDQFVEIGIAEQNEIGVAAGLSVVGKNPFVCAPACFLTARSLEQLKVDVAYSHQNVKVLGVSGGVSYGALGSSHHTLHDIATLRCIPDLTIILPSDAVQTEEVVRAIAQEKGAFFIRIGREKIPQIYTEELGVKPFTLGKANTLREGTTVTLVSCGELVYHTLEAAKILNDEGIEARVLDMATIKPFDEKAIIKAAKETGALVTIEEHSINGGLGATVSQIVCANHPVPVKTLAFPDAYLVTGNSLELFAHYGLDAMGIAASTKTFISQVSTL
nr:transketolase C-terminal domain-containing protein [uncultured Sphaerochaeta sp.]